MPGPLPSKHKRRKAYIRGIAAEYACAAWLVAKGYSILKIRYRNHSGEIDIITTRRKLVVFVEVKARTQQDTALPSVTPSKQRILAEAASGFIGAHAKYSDHGLRFDVMMVTSWVKITHVKDAWRPR